jgi:hypothetical protein
MDSVSRPRSNSDPASLLRRQGRSYDLQVSATNAVTRRATRLALVRIRDLENRVNRMPVGARDDSQLKGAVYALLAVGMLAIFYKMLKNQKEVK